MTSIYFIVFALLLFILFVYPVRTRASAILLFILIAASGNIFAQTTQPIDTVFPAKLRLPRIDTVKAGEGTPEEQVKAFKAAKKKYLSDTIGNQPLRSPQVDTTTRNRYGDLLNDVIKLNRKYPIWKPVVQVFGINGFIWSIDRFVLNADFSHIGPSTWNYNINKGWEWDDDRFGINFIGHP